MNLSDRLIAAASLVTEGNRLADIGTDHGYVPIYLIKHNRIPSAIAMDINEGPIKRARANIKEAGVEEWIQTRISDGLNALKPGEADTILICGMGGMLMKRILNDGLKTIESAEELVLSPHSDEEAVRRFLYQKGFAISKEYMLLDDGKYYVIFKAGKGHMDYQRAIDFKYGKLLLEEKNSVLKEYLRKQQEKLESIREHILTTSAEKSSQRIKELEKELEDIKEALVCWNVGA